jgi:cyclic pyranopterin phosphate synthase
VTWLDRSAILSFEEIEALARGALNLGIDKLRLTGGEPLVRRGIVKLVAMLGRIQGIKDFAMTTNGVLLADFAADLRLAGLGRLNISLDTLDPDRFREISRGGDLSRVLAGIDAAILAGFQRIKLNCVVESSREEADAQQVAAFGRERGFDVRFIRRMDLQEGHFWPVYGGEGGHCNRCNRLRISDHREREDRAVVNG